MAWEYRNPTKHDARVASIMKAVLASEDQELNYYLPTEAECRSLANKFRFFRWCVRQDPAMAGDFYQMEMEYDFRSRVKYHQQSGWHFLSIRAIPARLGYMHSLNPWIADLEA